jgi:hypothetical protein
VALPGAWGHEGIHGKAEEGVALVAEQALGLRVGGADTSVGLDDEDSVRSAVEEGSVVLDGHVNRPGVWKFSLQDRGALLTDGDSRSVEVPAFPPAGDTTVCR